MDLDVHATCALNAYDFRHCRPSVRTPHDAEERSSVRAKGMRHPLIEIVQDGREYVPNDFEVGTPDCCGALLYGLNAAGKSSLAKSLGVNVLLAQAGMYVAADAFELVPYTQLLSRVSTGDDIIMGHSTFTIEMSELRNILTRAGARSLVIGDELCAGTEYNSGLSIVAAGLQALSHSCVSFVLATHLHALPDIEEVQAIPKLRIFHLDVAISQETGQLQYNHKLMPGSGPANYGIEVCRSLRLPPGVILCAQKIRYRLENIEFDLVGQA